MNTHALKERCAHCDEEFEVSNFGFTAPILCPRCKRIDDAQYAIGAEGIGFEGDGWKYSQAAMRERLGVTGNRDE